MYQLNNIRNLTFFASILSYICMRGPGFGLRIRIQEAPEYGSNTDPDPQRIWIHNTAFKGASTAKKSFLNG